MEAGDRSRKISLILIIGVVLLLRLPFLNQAIQGDDPYYLFGAQHALIDPAHPSHSRWVFQGEMVDMRGHTHPPGNSWILAGLLAVFGDVYEVPFHAAYVGFSLIAAVSMWSLARRWSPEPLLATLLFLVVPAFVVSGNTLEADIPFIAFWLAGFALFAGGRYLWAAAALFLAAMIAYQAVVAAPILLLLERRSKRAWIAALSPILAVGLYQMYERLTGGALPATVLTGYFSKYALQQISNKLRNAAGLTVHTAWLVFPAAALWAFRSRWPVFVAAAVGGAFIDPHPLFWGSLGVGAAVIAGCVRKRPGFLELWVLVFFAAALVLFFAGGARYLLPMAPPVILLITQRVPRRWLWPAFGLNAIVALGLAHVSYQQSNAYRSFVASYPDLYSVRAWTVGEWGLRWYLEDRGAQPLSIDDTPQPGDWLITSDLGFPISVSAPVSESFVHEIRPTLPIRVVGLGTKSGYSTVAFGLRPFDFSTEPVDRVHVRVARHRQVDLEFVTMNSPHAQDAILSGVYQLEGDTRWMSGRALLVVKAPDTPKPVELQIYIPPQSKARSLRILVDGNQVHQGAVPAPGIHTIRTAPAKGSTIAVELDQTFSVPGDNRHLGAVLIALGFR